MALRDDYTYDLYLKMHTMWQANFPRRRQGLDFRPLRHLLALAAVEGGISQSALESASGLTEWGLSKIKRKLIREGWIRVWKAEPDQRRWCLATTPKAQNAMEALDATMRMILNVAVKATLRADLAWKPGGGRRCVMPRGTNKVVLPRNQKRVPFSWSGTEPRRYERAVTKAVVVQ